MSDQRQHAGYVWVDLARRHAEALRLGDMERQQNLFQLLKQIEAEYPEAVAIEKELWN